MVVSSCVHCWQLQIVAGSAPPFVMLEKVDVEIDGAIESGEEVTGAGYKGQPSRPN